MFSHIFTHIYPKTYIPAINIFGKESNLDPLVGVKLDDGFELKVTQPGDWREGQRVEVVIRAQKFHLTPREQSLTETAENLFGQPIQAAVPVIKTKDKFSPIILRFPRSG